MKRRPDVVRHTFNPNTWDTEISRSLKTKSKKVVAVITVLSLQLDGKKGTLEL